MRPTLRVLAPGLLTTVQDLGRYGFQRVGIPVSGALDPVSLRAANLLVGNDAGTGALEVAYVGPTLAIEADDVRISIVGAPAAVEILSDETATAGKRVEGMRSVRLCRGEVVRIGSLSGGAALYLAVEGGFDIDPVLGSVSTYLRGRLGGWQGRALVAGDQLPLRRTSASEREEFELDGLDISSPQRVRVILGPQSDHFSADEIAKFFDSEYTVCPGSDRMGMHLIGRQLRHAGGFDIVSDGIAPGSIQIPGNGQPIVLLADRQTTGGYPKIATVISADLPAMGRLPIGARISFEPVTIADAEVACRNLFSEFQQMRDRIVPLRAASDQVLHKLQDCNLISGFVDAAA